jgi:hypothetical protein
MAGSTTTLPTHFEKTRRAGVMTMLVYHAGLWTPAEVRALLAAPI